MLFRSEETDYLYFVDATEMTYDGENFKEELFVEDGLHLTEEGQQIWCHEYIIPAIEQVIMEHELDAVRN